MRINRQGYYRLRRGQRWKSLTQFVCQDGRLVSRRVVCFRHSRAQLTGALLGWWGAAYQDPWLIVTDLPLDQAWVLCYGLRAWIECGFKDFKRGGWHWEHTKMQHPERAERLWLVMAVAMLWALSVGTQADPFLSFPQRVKPGPLSCFALGLNAILAAVVAHCPLPFGRFSPLSWPKAPV